jgi:hypothetical protein
VSLDLNGGAFAGGIVRINNRGATAEISYFDKPVEPVVFIFDRVRLLCEDWLSQYKKYEDREYTDPRFSSWYHQLK